jgi:hypothetical protein
MVHSQNPQLIAWMGFFHGRLQIVLEQYGVCHSDAIIGYHKVDGSDS